MKVIALEEHYKLPAIAEEHHKDEPRIWSCSGRQRPGRRTHSGHGRSGYRRADLSHSVPGPETLEPSAAIELARQANHAAAAAVTEELERVVREHNFVGALINGHIRGRYLDDTFF